MYVMCKNPKCQTIFVIETRRGRPPSYCGNCTGRNTPETPQEEVIELKVKQLDDERKYLLARDRVDRLEMLLKSRGTHISQHRKDDW